MNKLTFLLLIISNIAFSQKWQYVIPVSSAKIENSKAFLWIPKNCKKIKAVVFAQHNMEEISILENGIFRNEMAKLGIAEIWVSPSFSHVFNFQEGAGDIFDGIMKNLAQTSGHQELENAPIIYIGHSAAASAPYYFAAWKPERTLAAISVSGQWPYFRHPQFAPDIWGDKNIDFIPCLETMGEYEAANTWCIEGLKERQEHPLTPLSMLACPAEGHFAATEKKIQFIIFYIKKAIQYRLPKNADDKLITIDPTKSGWLSEKWVKNQEPNTQSAPVNEYKGDTSQAFWFFDKETVREVEKYQSAYRNLKAPLIGYIQNGKIVEQKNTHQQVDLVFVPLADSITFRLETTFLDIVPSAHKRTSEWTDSAAGSVIEKPKKSSIMSEKISGPFEKITKNTFRLKKIDGYFPNKNGQYELWFIATSKTTKNFKPATQQARMLVDASFFK